MGTSSPGRGGRFTREGFDALTEHVAEPPTLEPGADPEPEPGADPEPEPGADPEPEPGGDDAGAGTETDVDKALERLAKEATRHANRVSEIMGADASELEPCPLCVPVIPGFRFPVAPDPEQRAAVLALLGIEAEPDYATAPDAEACEACGALGKVLTGSLVPEHRTKVCAACGGAGWRMVAAAEPAGANGSSAPATTPAVPLTVEQAQAPDAWDRPPGHPHYGLHPAYIT